MKKTVFLSIVVAALAFAGCDKAKDKTVEEKISLSKTTLTIDVGADYQLIATTEPADAAVTWSSSDETVATVVDGLVTGMSEGDAIITATNGKSSDTCEVTVNEPEPEPDIYDENRAPKLNDFYYSDGTWGGIKNPNKECIGVIFALDFDRSCLESDPRERDPSYQDFQNLVLALDESEDVMKWQADFNEGDGEDKAVSIAPTNYYNGYANQAKQVVTDNIDNLPVFKWCIEYAEEMGQDWYLPSTYEINQLFVYYNGSEDPADPFWGDVTFVLNYGANKAFNDRLTEAGGEILDAISYWSSSQHRITTSAARIGNFLDGYTWISPYKYYAYKVRPILAFQYEAE